MLSATKSEFNNWQSNMMKRNGFTLIELLIVIAIIGTLTAILLPNFMGARERAVDTRKIQELGALKNALRGYYNDHQAYPTPITDTRLADDFMVGISQIGYTYFMPTSGGVLDTDKFQLCVGLDSGAGDEDINSQRRCGATGTVGVCGRGTTIDKLYSVCAN